MGKMKLVLRQILCKHDYEIRRWHWCHGINGDKPRMIEAEVICQKCGKADYFYSKRGSAIEKTIIERNGAKRQVANDTI